MHKTEISSDTWLASQPEGMRDDLETLYHLIDNAMPGVSQTVWEGVFWGGTEQSILGFGDLISTQSRGRTVEWFMVGLAVQKSSISIYVHAVVDRRYVVESYADTLGKVKTGKSSIGIKRVSDVNLKTLRTVIELAYRQLPEVGT